VTAETAAGGLRCCGCHSCCCNRVIHECRETRIKIIDHAHPIEYSGDVLPTSPAAVQHRRRRPSCRLALAGVAQHTIHPRRSAP
jgi:hypothetical protein